jgi:hypothetical protein
VLPVSPGRASVMVGGAITLNALTAPDGVAWSAAVWTSSAPWIASVTASPSISNQAVVEALSVGTVVIYATVEETMQEFCVDVIPYTPSWVAITTTGRRRAPSTSSSDPVPVVPDAPDHALANCLSTDAVGDLVYITGARVAGKYQVTKADPVALASMPVMAAIIAKTSATNCTIQFWGAIGGIWSGMTPGRIYFTGDNGTISLLPPAPTILRPTIYVQHVGVAMGDDVLMFNPSFSMVVRVY